MRAIVLRRSAPRGLVVAALVAAAGCGGGTTTVTVVPTATPDGGSTPTPAATPTSSAGASATGPSGPAITLVWAVVESSGAIDIRAATPGGGPTRAVGTLPTGHFMLALGHGQAVAATPDHHILTVDVATGTQHTHPGGAGNLFGAAFDDTGRHLAFVDAIDPTTTHLRVLDLSTDTVSTVASLTNQFVAPQVWTGTTLAGPVVVGFSGAPQQGARTVSSTSGAQLAEVQVPNAGGYDLFGDASHGAATSHAALGDDADAPPGPGPQGPFNTLSTFTVPGTASTILSEAHHTISVLGGTPDGGTILIDDTSAAGGFAGISLSVDFGVFLVHGTARTQLAHYAGGRLGGALLQDGASAVVAEKTGSSVALVQYGPSGSPVTLDSLAVDAVGARVALVPSS